MNALYISKPKYTKSKWKTLTCLNISYCVYLDWLSCRGNLKRAQQLCDELGVLASSVTGVDMDLKAEASLRSARTLLAANQYSEVIYFSFP